MQWLLLLLAITAALEANPFVIDFPAKKQLSHEDYLVVQRKLRALDLARVSKNIYRANRGLWPLWCIEGRITASARHTLIDPARNQYPTIQIEQIGAGGPNCIVCYASYDRQYPELLRSIPDALRQVGFNGHFLSLLGGYPNPTGQEIRYAGVPYAFKIFLIREAMKRKFDNVLWIDSSFYPLRDPTPLFDIIQKTGGFIRAFPTPSYYRELLPPSTHKVLRWMSREDVLHQERHVAAQVLGFSRHSYKARRFIRLFYKYVEIGTPFLSACPEELVYTAIVARIDRERSWTTPSSYKLMLWPTEGVPDGATAYARGRREGYFFYYRRH